MPQRGANWDLRLQILACMCYTYGMRLALVGLSLLGLPAILLIAAAYTVAVDDHRFWIEAQEHVAHLDQTRQMNPAAARRAPFAREIATLAGSSTGADVRALVCSSRAAAYDPLFPDLPDRCAHITLFRRLQRASALALVLPVLTLILLLGIKSKFRRRSGASVVTIWTGLRGIHLPLLGAAAGSVAAASILLSGLGSARYWIAGAAGLALYPWSRRQTASYLGRAPQRRIEPEPVRKRRQRRPARDL